MTHGLPPCLSDVRRGLAIPPSGYEVRAATNPPPTRRSGRTCEHVGQLVDAQVRRLEVPGGPFARRSSVAVAHGAAYTLTRESVRACGMGAGSTGPAPAQSHHTIARSSGNQNRD